MTQLKHLLPQKARPLSGAVFNIELSTLQGGRFELGFISAFTSSLALSYTTGKSNDPLAIMGIGAAIGGTAESLGGGKFANGAVTGAFVGLFNHGMHLEEEERFLTFKDRDEAYEKAWQLQQSGNKEYAGYVFKERKTGEYLYVIDLLSPISETSCEWSGDAAYSFIDSGYSLDGIFHTHPNKGTRYATGEDLMALRNFNANYQDVISKGNIVYRYNGFIGTYHKLHPIQMSVSTKNGLVPVYSPSSIYKY